MIVSVAVLDTSSPVAVMVTGVVAATLVVVTVKLAVVACAGMVTVAGTVAAALLLDSVTTAPPVIAGLDKVTVPVEELPPFTVDGLNDTAEIFGVMAVTCSDPVSCVPL